MQFASKIVRPLDPKGHHREITFLFQTGLYTTVYLRMEMEISKHRGFKVWYFCNKINKRCYCKMISNYINLKIYVL